MKILKFGPQNHEANCGPNFSVPYSIAGDFILILFVKSHPRRAWTTRFRASGPPASSILLLVTKQSSSASLLRTRGVLRCASSLWVFPSICADKLCLFCQVIGAGPAGLAMSTECAARGHDVTLFEEVRTLFLQNLSQNLTCARHAGY